MRHFKARLSTLDGKTMIVCMNWRTRVPPFILRTAIAYSIVVYRANGLHGGATSPGSDVPTRPPDSAG